MLHEWMIKLVQELNLPKQIAEEVEGSYRFPIDDEVRVEIMDTPPGCRFFCSLIDCPKQNQEVVFEYLLLGNLFGQGTGGAILGIDENGQRLTLSRNIDYAIDYKQFKEILEDFCNEADFWCSEIRTEKYLSPS